MLCPHCLHDFAARTRLIPLGEDAGGEWAFEVVRCTNERCDRLIAWLIEGDVRISPSTYIAEERSRRLVQPHASQRRPPPAEVPKEIADLYTSAALIAGDAPEASAALSRRCLQQVLEGAGGATKRNLSDQIDEVVSAGVPSWVAEALHAVREIGNFGAHPIKDSASGTILPVEAGEVEWNLDTLDAVFDFYFVQPAKEKARKAAINQKLQAAGRKTI